MKKNLLCIWLVPLAILFSVNMHAQMTIGGKKEPEAFSVLELLNKGGLRLPQMSTAERDAFAVQGNDKGSGLTIYNKTTGCVEYWNKTRWVSLCDDTSVNALIAAENGLTAAGGKVQLGGALLKPTVLTTTAANTLTIQGLQTGAGTDNVLVADANGVLKWVTRAQFGGDNLGNHTATQDLVMSSKNITGAANITASGTVTGANLTATTKTTTPAAQITTGAGAGKVAVSDASGNLTWTDPATIAAKGDNLGNHTATQNLEMSTKDINNIATAYIKTGIDFSDRASATYPNKFILYKNNGALSIWNNLNSVNSISINETTNNTAFASTISFPTADGSKILFLGNTDAARVEHTTGFVLGNVAGIKTNPNSGQFSWSNYGAGGTQTELMRIGVTGNLGIGSTAPVSKLHVAGDMTLNKDFKVGGTATTAGNSGTDGQVLISKGSGAAPNWVDASTITAKGDNLGNHTATQDLAMSSKNITGAANVTASGTVTGANITATTKTTTPAAQITTGAGAGKVAVSDASGNLTWTDPATITAKGDNLGNHTATQDLAMSSKNITGAVNVTASGTVSGANITATTKTTTPAAQITTGAGAGKVAVSDASGNLTWTDPATIAAKGDNLGNHTATTNLDMTNNDINNIKTAKVKNELVLYDRTTSNTNTFNLFKSNGYFNIWNGSKANPTITINETTDNAAFSSTISFPATDGSKTLFLANADAARIEHNTGYNLTTVAGAKTAPGLGQFSWSNYNAGGTQTELMRLGATGNLGIGTTVPTNKLHVVATADPLKLEGLSTSNNANDMLLAVSSDGVVKKGSIDFNGVPLRYRYTSPVIANGESASIVTQSRTGQYMLTVSQYNACGRTGMAIFMVNNGVISFMGGQARVGLYTSTIKDGNGASLGLTADLGGGCGDGGGNGQFNFDIAITNLYTVTITNKNGTIPQTYYLTVMEN